MTNTITWILVADLPEGRLHDLRAIMDEMTEATRASEPGCLIYDWHVSEDGRLCHILESYADEAALMTHVAAFNSRFARRLFGIVKPRALTVYGPASAAVRQALAPLNPVYLQRL
jgi:quinol monooxygenase YgiN